LARLLQALLLTALLLGGALPAHRIPAAHAQSTDDEIVLIDPEGKIFVRDPHTDANRLPVVWTSPVGNYVNVTLVDANRDGDMEIVGLRVATENGAPAWRLDLYDPVIASGTLEDPKQTIGGIPWRLLYSLPLARKPVLVAAGDLDPGAPGDEIFVTESDNLAQLSEEIPIQRSFFLRIAGDLDGRAWERVDLPIRRDAWSSVAVGNLDGTDTDEIALVQSEEGVLEIWRVLGASAWRVFDNESDDKRWTHAAFGRWRGEAAEQLAAVREGSGYPTLYILRYHASSGAIRDDHSEVFAPGPLYAFFGDVNASGDDELFMLRAVPGTDPSRARLIGRGRNDDGLGLQEDPLNPDNGYLAGAAGDINGDGRDEVVIIRSNTLRTYDSPGLNASAIDTPLALNPRHIVTGDLDRNGYPLPVQLVALPSVATATLRSGASGAQVSLALSAVPGAIPPIPVQMPISARVMATSNPNTGRAPAWLHLEPQAGQTPATFNAIFDASSLTPGTYTADIFFASSNQLVVNQPYTVPATLTVQDGLLAKPQAVSVRVVNCPAVGVTDTLRTATLEVVAPPDTTYQASLVEALPAAAGATETHAPGGAVVTPDLVTWPSSVPWAKAQSPSGIASEMLLITVDASKRTRDLDTARLILTAVVDGELLVRSVPLVLICAQVETFLPLVER